MSDATITAIENALQTTETSIVNVGINIEQQAVSAVTQAAVAIILAAGPIIVNIPEDELIIIQKAAAVGIADIKAGKSWGVAAADTWTEFYNDEVGEISQVGRQLLDLILSGAQTAQTASS